VLSPLVKEAKSRKLPLPVLFYSVGGIISSAIVGYIIAKIGSYISYLGISVIIHFTIIGVGILSYLRESFFKQLPIPELKRQTPYHLIYKYKIEKSSFIWGMDLGTVFSTYHTFSGIWLLTAILLSDIHPLYGSLILGSYWMGKCLTIWMSYFWIEDTSQANESTLVIHNHIETMRIIHIVGIVIVLVGYLIFTSIYP
jgi:hypothetical protein